ncbi:hypothetical protein [Microcoleus sp. herbarium14]|uniref:hypothetical protein n=1 Tax=Microcoleus sp. herbarium14 TaxID=3055439 RepID=UPI002FCF06D1
MKNQLDEVSIEQVALVRCVASILYTSIHRQYRLFPVLPILPCPAVKLSGDIMAKQLSKKSVILGLASLTIAGLAYVVNVKKERAEIDKYLDEYQEEAYS